MSGEYQWKYCVYCEEWFYVYPNAEYCPECGKSFNFLSGTQEQSLSDYDLKSNNTQWSWRYRSKK